MPPLKRSELDYRPSYLAAGIASLLVFILYLITLAPSTSMWDTSEYIAAAHTLGLPHPPGNPFFVLIGRVFDLLPIASNTARRINILAALSSAVAAGMWFLITERVLVSWLPQRWQRITGGAIATLLGSTAFTVWNQSVVNEKVYTVSLAIFAIVAWLTVKWCDDHEGEHSDRLLVLIAFLLGLGYANHPAGMLPLPAVAVAVLVRQPRVLLRWKLILALAGSVTLGMTPFATQPIRAAYFPAINEGEPTGCRTKIEIGCTFSKGTWDAFKYNFNREQYGKPRLSDRQAPFLGQVDMWWFYFKWQWVRDAHDRHPRLQTVLAALFLVLGLFGGYVHWRYDRLSFSFFGPLVFTLTLALIYYLNFKYGASQRPELGDSVAREVRDRDYFFLWSFSAWSVWAGLGLVFLWESLAALAGSDRVKFGTDIIEVPRRTSWIVSSPMLALAIVPLFANWKEASRANQTDARDFAADLLNSVEPYGILVTVGDNDTFPIWYAQEVEGIRKDVVLANTSLLNTDWYTRQMLRRPVYEYDEKAGPEMYRGKVWTKPTKPPFNMTMDEADRVPLGQDLPTAQVFHKPYTNLTATIQPRFLARADIFVLRMILDQTERPIYFSRTSGGYGQELGLQPYLLTQGLARKLLFDVPKVGQDTVLVQGEGFVDLPRTKALWKDVFQAPRSLIRRGDWVDRPSVGIPYLYVATGIVLADAMMSKGQTAEARGVLATAGMVAKATHIDELYGINEQSLMPPEAGDTAPTTAIPLNAPVAAPATEPPARRPTSKTAKPRP